jgi:hypothetical protein
MRSGCFLAPFVSLLAMLLPGQQQEQVLSGESAFDSNQWNHRDSPARELSVHFPLLPSVGVLLPWAAPESNATVTDLMLGIRGLLVTGSTLRGGERRKEVKQMVGRIRQLDRSQLSFGERLGTTVLLYDTSVASSYPTLHKLADGFAEQLQRELAATTPCVLPALELLELHLLVERVQGVSPQAAWLGDLRAAAHAATCSDRPGASRRSDAALLLVRQLRGERVPADLLLAVCWPTNPVLDPVHTWLGVLAAERVTAAERAPLLPQLERLLAARHGPAADERAGSWEPAGELSRAATTAWHMRSLRQADMLWSADRRAAARTAATARH